MGVILCGMASRGVSGCAHWLVVVALVGQVTCLGPGYALKCGRLRWVCPCR
jgi:hypothetical protein